ncbi:sugar phosphate isomerase/epimerase [Streptomyces macrosporus]|uniref:Sugar phosphate isomerase/epimerase n=1 Tax=Streptomyces macrosporus TaxID=44032 RepID=A0ABP5WYE9_9ACTN
MIMDRIAGAPISWGVCEVPGWGHQLAPHRVLAEMGELGLAATEFGPDGFLPDEPEEKADLLRSYGLRAVGGFVPAVVHDPDRDPLPVVDAALDGFVAAGAGTLVLAAATGLDGYDERPALDAAGWATLFANLDRITERCALRGVSLALHPHMGTLVERREEVDRVLEGSEVPLCLDTGHLLAGGTDPVELVRQVPERITHTHLKDVDAAVAARVRAGELPYYDAVCAGMYRPLGEGDVDIAEIVRLLEASGYAGWYVMEQDTVLTGEPEGEGPLTDVRAGVRFLGEVDAGLAAG